MENAKRGCFRSSDDESFSSLNVEVSNSSSREVSFAEIDTSERMDTSDLEHSSAEKIGTDETSSCSSENASNVEGAFSKQKNVVSEFCSEEKTAGTETSSSSIEVLSDEEPSSGKNVVKLASEEKTVNETSSSSTEIISDVERSALESSSVESPDPIKKGRESFEHLDYVVEITENLISSLLKRFKINQYFASSTYGEDTDLVSNCIYLFRKSYTCELIRNTGGTLSDNYPSTIIIPVKENTNEEERPVNQRSCASKLDADEYAELIGKCLFGRVRKRFPVPVILIDGKFFCRSATLSNELSSASENIKQQPEPRAEMIHEDNFSMAVDVIMNVGAQAAQVATNIAGSTSTLLFSESLEDVRRHDRNLMKYLDIDFIFDLMVEMEKVYIIRVTSSEKVQMDSYENFNIAQIPYPGCEFFEEYHRNNRNPEGLKFDWEQPSVTVECKVPESFIMYLPETDYSQYKEWDLVKLTEEYLLLQLVVITSGSHSALVHCISGWDRTPLFTSLIRLSLWADHWIHDELTPVEMAYLTLGYDWYLFGHNLPARLRKNEEIMHFCFQFLSYIASDKFSMTKHWSERPEDLKIDRKFPEFIADDRRKRLEKVQEIVIRLYDAQDNTHND